MGIKDIYLTISETAKELNVSKQTIYRWLAENKFPSEKIGGVVLIDKKSVLEYKTQQRDKSFFEVMAANIEGFLRKEYKYGKEDEFIDSGVEDDYLTYIVKRENGKFEKIIEIHDDGFVFDNKRYKWNDIKRIKRYDSILCNLLFYQGGTPRAYIYLNDGKCIKLRGRILQKENEHLDIDSIKGSSSAYKELIELLTNKKKDKT